ncbi:MAG: cation diffusion facilitator family transporter [Candidatus Gastranaerophilales bacterium]|nr:cation diffusion facilitator family transporter [Candidatus Gastranaerophilales bacterium]
MEKKFLKEKKFAAMLSILSNSTLIALKFIAGILSGSIGIISEAIHSSSDLLASVITFFSVTESSKPADEDHHFGHGKYEDFASLIEGILIILAAFYIVYEALKKIVFAHTLKIDANIGLIVMFISIFANILVSTYLFKTAKKTGSTALYADGEHLRTDVYSSLAVFVGLLFVKVTGNPIFDPIIAIIVAVIVFLAGYKICDEAKRGLLDTSLSEQENLQIKDVVNNYLQNGVIALKNLRTRKTGLKKNIEITLIVEKTMHISTSHKLCDEIEEKIEAILQNTDITIHLEPN